MRSRPVAAARGAGDDPPLPMHLLERIEAALDRQMWAWGRDIRHPRGNPLPELGFERLPRASGAQAASAYRCDHPDGRLVLWSFGLLCERGRRAVALRRHDPLPRIAATWDRAREPIATPEQFQARGRAATSGDAGPLAQLLAAACGRIAAYERDAERLLGARWRHEVHAAWPRRAPWPGPGDGAALWRDLGAAVAAAVPRARRGRPAHATPKSYDDLVGLRGGPR